MELEDIAKIKSKFIFRVGENCRNSFKRSTVINQAYVALPYTLLITETFIEA